MAESTTRRGKTTPENIEESRLLKALYQTVPHDLTQEAFGQKHGIGNQGAVWQFLNGKTAISMNAAKGFAEGLRCEIAAFSPRLAKEAAEMGLLANPGMNEFAAVPRARIGFSAGHGSVAYDDGWHSSLSFRRDYLASLGILDRHAVLMNVTGHGMEPTIGDGAILLVNSAYQEVTSGLIYAFRLDDQLHIKRMHKTATKYCAISDNPDKTTYPDMEIGLEASDFEMIGRAMWIGKKL